MTSNKNMKKILFAGVFGCVVAGTAFAGLDEVVRDAKRGEKSAQQELSSRYVSGNEVVKDDVFSEQWRLRSNPTMSATGGGNALAALEAKRAVAALKTDVSTAPKSTPKKAEEKSSTFVRFSSKPASVQKSVPAKKEKTPARVEVVAEEETEEAVVQVDDFQMLLRAASQGNSKALQRFRTEADLANRLKAYAQTPEGKRDPFVREVIKRLRNK